MQFYREDKNEKMFKKIPMKHYHVIVIALDTVECKVYVCLHIHKRNDHNTVARLSCYLIDDI